MPTDQDRSAAKALLAGYALGADHAGSERQRLIEAIAAALAQVRTDTLAAMADSGKTPDKEAIAKARKEERSKVANEVAGDLGLIVDAALKSGIVDFTGPEPIVRRMCPKADGTPSVLPVTKDGAVIGKGSTVYYNCSEGSADEPPLAYNTFEPIDDLDAPVYSTPESAQAANATPTPHQCGITCNPACPQCKDTPSCGDGAWTWAGSHWLHRCRGVDPQAGYNRVDCDKAANDAGEGSKT